MSITHVNYLKTACWLAVVGFLGWAAWYATAMHQLFTELSRPASLGICGNALTDPLEQILSVGTPAAGTAVLTLGYFWRQRSAKRWSVILAALLMVTCTAALVAFGMRLHRDLPGQLPLSAGVWWMWPAWRLFGV